jgi:glutamate synthase domain-containing protein 2
VGVTTQDSALELRLDPAVGAKRLKNYLKYVNMELTTIARASGKRAALPAPPVLMRIP